MGLSRSFSITDMPEAIAALRREMAKMLRDRADKGPASPEELREMAAAFEAGQPEDDANMSEIDWLRVADERLRIAVEITDDLKSKPARRREIFDRLLVLHLKPDSIEEFWPGIFEDELLEYVYISRDQAPKRCS